MKKFTFILSFTMLLNFAWGQNLTGSWYGKADISNGNGYNNYLIELILKENGNQVQGIVGYYFKNTYQSFIVKGSFDRNSRELTIKNVPIMNYASTGDDDLECPMNFSGAVLISKVKSSMLGYFYASDALKYKCPDLKVTLQRDENDHLSEKIAQLTPGKKTWKAPPNQIFINSAPAVVTQNTPTVAPPVTVAKNEKVTVKKEQTQPAAPITSPVPAPIAPPPPVIENPKTVEEKRAIEVFEKRSNNYLSDLEVISDSIRVSFYDNGEIDGDTISVFVNKTPVILQKGISTRALTAFVTLDPSKPVNELSMLAENLGKYPPNTALMVLTDGFNTYEVYLSSSFTQNATVRLRRKKK